MPCNCDAVESFKKEVGNPKVLLPSGSYKEINWDYLDFHKTLLAWQGGAHTLAILSLKSCGLTTSDVQLGAVEMREGELFVNYTLRSFDFKLPGQLLLKPITSSCVGNLHPALRVETVDGEMKVALVGGLISLSPLEVAQVTRAQMIEAEEWRIIPSEPVLPDLFPEE